jgi:threonine-phosphate decarboxylase
MATPFAHGGNVYEIASRLHCAPEDILDYSASINPLGPPHGLFDEFRCFFDRLQHYPDIHNHSLLHQLSVFHELPAEQIVVGNGSTELIYWLPRVLGIGSAVIVLPTFSEYQRAFEIQSVHLHKLVTRPEHYFQPTVEQLEEVYRQESPEAILVTHPGSPAGTLLSADVLQWLVEKSRATRSFCIVDEAFVDFCEDQSWKRWLRTSEHLILIRSMTKFYGIPGLRLGYLLTSPSIAGRLRASLPPWSVNTLAQIAGRYCLTQEEYRRRTLELVGRERATMSAALASIQGWTVFPGVANYLLTRLADGVPAASVLQQELLEAERILVRDCSSFEGLDDRYVRFAIRLPEQNQRLLNALSRWRLRHQQVLRKEGRA